MKVRLTSFLVIVSLVLVALTVPATASDGLIEDAIYDYDAPGDVASGLAVESAGFATSAGRLGRAVDPAIGSSGDVYPSFRSHVAPSSRLGGLVDVAVDDPAAAALAQRLGGRPSVRFAGDASGREFDVVSDLYVAQSKPANFQLGSSFRNQAKATFETALETNRTPYFHFEGPPQAGVIAKLEEYGARYGIDPIIDVSPLG